jgi:hypothetical protein
VSNRLKCRVDGCPGFVDVVTNGGGRAVDTPCPCCEKRAEWVRRNTPKLPPVVCAVCGGQFPRVSRGHGNNRKYCAACRKEADRVMKRRNHLEKQHGVLPIRRGAA